LPGPNLLLFIGYTFSSISTSWKKEKINTYIYRFMKKPAMFPQEGSGKQKRLEETEETVTIASLLYLASYRWIHTKIISSDSNQDK
jgi:hypothetical protein